MLQRVLKKVFGTKHQRQVKKIQPLVDKIGSLEKTLQPLRDDELKAKTAEFKQRIDNGESLDELLPEAYATVREAATRTLGMRHYDVQMIGAIAMHRGMVLEMRTGEGKTLTATAALYLNALSGRGAHLITVNDYLASRDAEWMGQIYNYLGLSVGAIVHGLFHHERQTAYRRDITYGTNNEFGFDYLRDNMKETIEKYVQRELNYAIVDEVDSILIDEARTPLIISGESAKPAELYKTVDRAVPQLRKDLDYVVDEKASSAQLTDAGVDRIEKLLGCKNLYAKENTELKHHVDQGLRAHVLYKRDVNYLVEKGEIVIVDEFTGRKMEGRRWSDGLHQAIEAKENVPIQPESQTLATITYQNYFRMYDKLAGMTGTADTEAEEFHKIYNLEVLVVPTNREIIRNDMDDVVYKSERGKFMAAVKQIRECHERGQPVLVGTTSVEKSQVIHQLLERSGVPHSVLNAKNHEREAYIVAQAGRKHAITVATNMAGRGTDIILGGNAELMAKAHYDPDKEPEAFAKLHAGLKEQCEAEKKEVLGVGGLFILGTERHESRRIDNQLRGRAGRQGDPGASRFFLSLEDDLMRIFGADRISGLMERLGMEEDVPIEAPMVNKAIENAQTKVEAMHFDTRKNLFEYDNVMNEQRKAIYALRRQILEGRYQPEILDDEARKEQKRKLPPPPETSGPHTIPSLAESMRERTVAIIDRHCREQLVKAGLDPEVEAPFPPSGIVPHELTHDIYRHYGSLVSVDDVRMDRDKLIARALDVVAASLIQQRERIHDLCYEHIEKAVMEQCPEDVHPDEWELEALENQLRARFYVDVDLSSVQDDIDKLVDTCWDRIEASLLAREQEFGLYVFLYQVRRIYLREIDEQWIGHLKDIEQLRAGIGLLGYANKNPKNAYKIEGFQLFRDMWESIAQTVLDQVLQMRLSEEDKRRAEEGAEYESTLTKASRRRERSTVAGRSDGQLQRLDAAAKAAVAKLKEQSLGTRTSSGLGAGVGAGERAAAAAAIAQMQREAQAAAPAPTADEVIEASAAEAVASLKIQKDAKQSTGRRKRRKKA
ncbi:preprotein translocase subunit SecA [Enhygromyxa salina]|uniref:Protein translocase subunit SecA n=2 Tax=Enhygromyxa salina TaxID=215803 RepID=A0A2S9XU07_9BACT|nr:preprotein translocase subunit SecA [Enhygromyxa salina]PRP96359.1 preprotein translocase subunit SecA [Enhygromyxa salina]